MKNDKYWANRAAKLMYGFMDEAEDEADSISKIYERASGWLSIEAEEIFERFRMKHGLSEKEARRLLSKIRDKEDLQELMRKLEAGDYSEMGKQELIRALEAPAYRARLERLQQLQNQISLIMRDVYQQELQRTTQFYTDLANEAYYRSMFEVQQRAGYGFSFNHLDNKTVNRILKSKWSGKNYSSRIWKNTAALAETVKEEVLISFITGRTDREAAEVIRNKFASGAMEARRLIRTESAFVSGEVTARAYKEAEIEKYRYVAILDLKTSEICRELDGQEFALKDKKVGTNYPPMHPWCRSTTIAAPTAEELAKMKRRARDPVTGKTFLVSASMTYKEWYDRFVRGSLEAGKNKRRPEENMATAEGQKERIYQAELNARVNPKEKTEDEMKVKGLAKANALFVNKNERLFINASKIKKLPDYEDFTCHATPDVFQIDLVGEGREEEFIDLSPQEYAKRIKNSTVYNGGKIRIISCQAGAKEDGAAQQLSDALGVDVLAPTEIVNVDDDGNIFLTDNDILAQMWYNSDEKDSFHETGSWKVFHPRKKAGERHVNTGNV